MVGRPAFEGFMVKQTKFVGFLFLGGKGEEITRQAVLGVVCGEIFAEFVNQVSVDTVSFGYGLAAEVNILALVPVAAGELLQGSFGVVGLGDDMVVGGLFAHDFAVRLSGDDLNVLLVDVLASQFFAAVLVCGHAGHDGVGGEQVVGPRLMAGRKPGGRRTGADGASP